MDAEKIKKMLGLEPLAEEGGFFRQTYKSTHLFAAPQGVRSAGTAIYYLVTPESFSKMHRVKSDEIFHYYVGDASVRILQWTEGKAPHESHIGTDLARGERPQIVIPAGVWQGTRLSTGGTWALLGTTVHPGFEYEDFELGKVDYFAEHAPQWADKFREFC